MKQIQEYLLSKKHTKAKSGFLDINEGDIKTKQDVIDFFEEKNFKIVHATYVRDFYDEFKKSNQPVYWVGFYNSSPDTHWVRFGKGGKATEDNPIMFWRLTKIKNAPTYAYMTSKDQANIDTFDEFKDYVNKIFDN